MRGRTRSAQLTVVGEHFRRSSAKPAVRFARVGRRRRSSERPPTRGGGARACECAEGGGAAQPEGSRPPGHALPELSAGRPHKDSARRLEPCMRSSPLRLSVPQQRDSVDETYLPHLADT